MVKGNVPINRHIMNRITIFLVCVFTIDFPAIPSTMFALKIFHLANARLKIYIIKDK